VPKTNKSLTTNPSIDVTTRQFLTQFFPLSNSFWHLGLEFLGSRGWKTKSHQMGTTEVSKTKSLTNSRSIDVMARQFFDPFVSSPQIPFDIWV
jgi:hypothetical protein